MIFKMTQRTSISFLYSGLLLLLGISALSHIGVSAPTDISIVHNATWPTKLQDETLPTKTFPVHRNTTAVHSKTLTNDSSADPKIHATMQHSTSPCQSSSQIHRLKGDSHLHALDVVRALKIYLTRTQQFRKTEHLLVLTSSGKQRLKASKPTAAMKDPPEINQTLSTIRHGNGHSEEPVTNEPEKLSTTTSSAVENSKSERLLSIFSYYILFDFAGIIIAFFVGLFIIFVIFALITVLRRRKLNSYSFELPNKSSEEAGIPLNNVKA
ncbi:hypothetical protein PRIEUP_LOCUS16756 [Pristimantis euphronides]